MFKKVSNSNQINFLSMVGHGSEIRREACSINKDKGFIKTKSSDYDFRQLHKT